jgi:hypothetical protein
MLARSYFLFFSHCCCTFRWRHIALADADLKVLSGNSVVFESEISLSGTEFTLNQTIPTNTWAAGTYTLELIVRDDVQNVSDKDVTIVLVP